MKYITQRTCGVSWILGWCNSTPYLEADVFSDQSALWAISRKPITALMTDVNKPVRPGKSQLSKDFELLSGFKVQYDHGRCRVGFWREEIWRQNLHFTSACFCFTAWHPGVTRVPRECCVRFMWRPASFYFTNYVNSSQVILRGNLSDNIFFSK